MGGSDPLHVLAGGSVADDVEGEGVTDGEEFLEANLEERSLHAYALPLQRLHHSHAELLWGEKGGRV